MSTSVDPETGPKQPKKANLPVLPQQRGAGAEEEGNVHLPTTKNADPATNGAEDPKPTLLAKERKKPRKLIRSTPSSSNVPKAAAEIANDTDETKTPLEVRLQKLEQQYQNVTKRLDTNAREIGRLQASTSPHNAAKSTSRTRSSNRMDSPRTNISPMQQGLPQNTAPALSAVEQDRRPQGRIEEVEDEDIEAIPRLDGPVVEQRSVALAGNYKIPLPSTLSTDDVRAIQSGIAAAGSVAREITAAIRTSGPSHNGGGGSHDSLPTGKETDKTTATPDAIPKSPRGWSSFLTDCSKLVANAASAIEMDAAVESKGKGRRDVHPPQRPHQRRIASSATSAPNNATSTRRPSSSESNQSLKAYQNPTKASSGRRRLERNPSSAAAFETQKKKSGTKSKESARPAADAVKKGTKA